MLKFGRGILLGFLLIYFNLVLYPFDYRFYKLVNGQMIKIDFEQQNQLSLQQMLQLRAKRHLRFKN